MAEAEAEASQNCFLTGVKKIYIYNRFLSLAKILTPFASNLKYFYFRLFLTLNLFISSEVKNRVFMLQGAEAA